MKKRLLLMVVATGLRAASTIPVIPDPDFCTYALVHGEKKPFVHLVSLQDLCECLTYGTLEDFQKLERLFGQNGLDIFNIRLCGSSLLQAAIERYEENILRNRSRKLGNEDALIDYILAKVTAEQLNEFVETSFSGSILHGTAAATAAFFSPRCLEKIVGHPLFDPTNFTQRRSVKRRFSSILRGSTPGTYSAGDDYRTFHSETMASCLDCVRERKGKEAAEAQRLIVRNVALGIIKKRFPPKKEEGSHAVT